MANHGLSPAELRQVFFDNVRDNQIGGETDGIDPSVAEDIGYSTDIVDATTAPPHRSDSLPDITQAAVASRYLPDAHAPLLEAGKTRDQADKQAALGNVVVRSVKAPVSKKQLYDEAATLSEETGLSHIVGPDDHGIPTISVAKHSNSSPKS